MLFRSVSDNDNMIIASDGKDKVDKELYLELKNNGLLTQNMETSEVKNDKYIIQTRKVKNTGWNMISLIPEKELTADMNPIRKTGFLLSLVTIIIVILISLRLIRNVTKPMSLIIADMKEIGRNNTNSRVNVSVGNEINILSKGINKMLERIESSTQLILNAKNEVYNAKLAQKQAQLLFLQSQINPHFLYNTLNCIRSIAINYKIGEIDSITESLSKILRYCLMETDVVSIKEEIACATYYFNIITIRYMSKFKMEVFIENEIMEKQILRMTLQPIIENSIQHGFAGKIKEGIIIIKANCNENNIVIEISDNGKGMEETYMKELNSTLASNEEKSDKSTEHHGKYGIGLCNINDRLKLKYGYSYGIEIFSCLDEGTTVKIRIPNTLV